MGETRVRLKAMARRLSNTVLALCHTTILLFTVLFFHHVCNLLCGGDSYLYWFLALFTWRYLRFVVNLVGFWCYRPSRKPSDPTYTSADVTAVIPTLNPDSKTFHETLKSCANNKPAKIVVVTAGDELYTKARSCVMGKFAHQYPKVEFVVLRSQLVNKRAQVALAVPEIKTDITLLLDDHVFWGPKYLETILCPFENSKVGLVGTNKRVRRKEGLGLWGRTWNMLGATYLCRHNFEIRATNTIDGGVFVVSGRTCAIRTEILGHPEFVPGFVNERFFLGLFGPLNADDDNYNTRFAVRHGWKIKIQYTEDAVMETDLGVEKPLVTKFLAQCRRWSRTTWRSNLCSLITDRSVWASQPYCVYAVYLTSLTNFAAIVDPLLVYLLTQSAVYHNIRYTLPALLVWILFTKTVKVFDYFRRHPRDIPLFPAHLLFAYFHSLIKLWALLTFWDLTWSGRRLNKINTNISGGGGGPYPPRFLDLPSPTIKPPSSSIFNPTPASQHHQTPQPNPAPESKSETMDHPHLTTLRAIRRRITSLRATQEVHQRTYQQPLLAELQQLRQAFETLAWEYAVMEDGGEAVGEELREVVMQAEEVERVFLAGGSGCGGGGDGEEREIGEVIRGVRDAMRGLEARWREGGEKGTGVGEADDDDDAASRSTSTIGETTEVPAGGEGVSEESLIYF
jgi:cellulose synthase/poly-beta-1,6-N-acetylglucosamine synthase-like glycosyltransferase